MLHVLSKISSAQSFVKERDCNLILKLMDLNTERHKRSNRSYVAQSNIVNTDFGIRGHQFLTYDMHAYLNKNKVQNKKFKFSFIHTYMRPYTILCIYTLIMSAPE